MRSRMVWIAIFFLSAVGEAAVAAPFEVRYLDASLNGEWLFQEGDDLSWKEEAFDDAAWSRVQVPALSPAERKIENGWYRVHLRISSELAGEDLGVFLGRIGDADEAYFNGIKIGSTSWGDSHRYFTNHRNRVYRIPELLVHFDADNVLAVRFHKEFLKGVGIFSGDVRIGEYNELSAVAARGYLFSSLSVFIAAFVIFFISLCYLCFFLTTRKLKEYLYFVLSSFFISILAFTISRVPYEFIPYAKLLYRINNISVILSIAFLVLFGQEFFNKKRGVHRVIRWLNLAVALLLVPFMAVAPSYELISAVYACWFIYMLSAVAYLALVASVDALSPRGKIYDNPKLRRIESSLLAISFSIFFGLLFHDVAIFLGWHVHYNLNPLGYFTITLAMAFSLAIRFAKWHQENIRLQKEKMQSDHLASVGEMVFSIAHDIKSPLGVVVSHLEGKNGLSREEAYQEGKRLQEVVKNLFDYSRQTVVRKIFFDFNELVEDRVNVLKHSLDPSKNLSIMMTFFRNKCPILVDPAEMGRVVDNLLSNAAAACSRGGKIEISTNVILDADREVLECLVKDSGCGIPSDIREKVFTPAFSTKGEKNAGMGLPTALKIVNLHGGKLSFESEVGKGSTFSIRLPFLQAER